MGLLCLSTVTSFILTLRGTQAAALLPKAVIDFCSEVHPSGSEVTLLRRYR
ncbi:hypothetical protein [Nostoc commune]|uniref:hypothetical protein n=1 Tax=Nostoc commune TaxID=1178 RepID=UPI0020740779|nr:hypothetical protein [Nostoc commune]